MGQVTFDDEELFGEAADEVRADVESALGDARAALPDPDEVWAAEADNVLGVLNGLRTAMDPGAAEDHLRDAKKWYTLGERAEAFDDADDLAVEIEAVEEVVGTMHTAREQVSDLAGAVPELRSALEDAHGAGDGGDAGEEDADDADGEDADDGAEDADGVDESEEAAGDAEDGEEAAADGGEAGEGEQATLEGDD